MSITSAEIKRMIEAGIDGAQADVDGDGAHFVARVVSDAFAGQPMLKQHRMVYAALGDSFKSVLHALSIQTYTRADWERASRLQIR